jgi:glucokinase
VLATGGVYLGGGIPPKILPFLEDGFMRAFVAKGRFSNLLEGIPVQVIINELTALLGAALRAQP